MICLTFLNLYPCVKLLLACAENAFVGNKIPAKIATFCVKRLMCSVIYLKWKQLQIHAVTDGAPVKYEALNYSV